MTASRYAPDHGLSARMVVTMVLLAVLYVVLMVALVYAGLPWGLVVILSAVLLLAQWYFSDRMALHALRGRVVTADEAPELHAVIDRLCALADMPKPVIAIADSDMPNAFATGRSARRAVVCVTTGLLRRLERDELEGVLAHELSHVAHRDVAVMTIASFVSVVAGLLLRMVAYGGAGPRRRGDRGGGSAVLLVVVASIAVYAVSFLLIRVLSRYRELSADRAGAQLTGQPAALASALVKISGEMGRIPTTDLRGAEPYNAFFLVPALASGFSISSLFSTHPSLEQRLERLRRLAGDLGRRI